jgi:hypothetical protein
MKRGRFSAISAKEPKEFGNGLPVAGFFAPPLRTLARLSQISGLVAVTVIERVGVGSNRIVKRPAS